VNTRPVICHFHMFKNAGTSLDGALQREFGSAFAEYDGPRANYALSPAEVRAFIEPRPALRAFSSHQVRFPLPEIEEVLWLPAILLRHPLDRAASVYRFERKQRSSSPGATQAKRLDLTGYVRWRLGQGAHNLLCDFQTAFLSSNPAEGVRRADLAAATARLESAPLAGTVERMDESLACAEPVLHAHLPGLDLSYRMRNVGRDRGSTLAERLAALRTELGDELYAELAARNARDFRLHERANALLDARLAAHAEPAALLAGFAARCAARRSAEVA
jgi:hypothetical protein